MLPLEHHIGEISHQYHHAETVDPWPDGTQYKYNAHEGKQFYG